MLRIRVLHIQPSIIQHFIDALFPKNFLDEFSTLGIRLIIK